MLSCALLNHWRPAGISRTAREAAGSCFRAAVAAGHVTTGRTRLKRWRPTPTTSGWQILLQKSKIDDPENLAKADVYAPRFGHFASPDVDESPLSWCLKVITSNLLFVGSGASDDKSRKDGHTRRFVRDRLQEERTLAH